MFILKSVLLFSFIFFSVQNVRSIFKRKLFIPYKTYKQSIDGMIREINEEMVQEVTQMYDEVGRVVDASAMIMTMRRVIALGTIFYPVLVAFIYQTTQLSVVTFALSLVALVNDFCLEQILRGNAKSRYLKIGYLTDHLTPFFNIALVILMTLSL